MRRFAVKRRFKWLNEGAEQVEDVGAAGRNNVLHVRVGKSTEHQWRRVTLVGCLGDCGDGALRCQRIGHERDIRALEFDIRELREQAGSQHFRSDSGAIGDKKNTTFS